MSDRPESCPRCAMGGTLRYCARLRCLCLHPECWAFGTHRVRRPTDTYPIRTVKPAPASTSWADREDSTWIDKM